MKRGQVNEGLTHGCQTPDAKAGREVSIAFGAWALARFNASLTQTLKRPEGRAPETREGDCRVSIRVGWILRQPGNAAVPPQTPAAWSTSAALPQAVSAIKIGQQTRPARISGLAALIPARRCFHKAAPFECCPRCRDDRFPGRSGCESIRRSPCWHPSAVDQGPAGCARAGVAPVGLPACDNPGLWSGAAQYITDTEGF